MAGLGRSDSAPPSTLCVHAESTHAHTHTHTHAHAHAHAHTRTHGRTDARTHGRTDARTHGCTHARTRARTHTHTHTHGEWRPLYLAHTHTQLQGSAYLEVATANIRDDDGGSHVIIRKVFVPMRTLALPRRPKQQPEERPAAQQSRHQITRGDWAIRQVF